MIDRSRKYESTQLISMFRLAAELYERMISAGFTANGGAIHSAERILNILGLALKYPNLSHINNLRLSPNAEFSVNALAAYHAGQKVYIEHVSPHRDLTRKAIEKIGLGASDEEFADFVRANFRLVLLTAEETAHLNRQNRSTMDAERLAKAGISIAPSSGG